ncbi:Signal transduction histidine kinase [Loktanella atrilutea]|uniref:histidine kinase n=1 Tax=Loktanella atrilutea TaxID=366533 RepID=A0A1M4ZJM5_LOKAT|nr:hybrid sensor histidine kinase/response regulator [Loktanella atrilutea]SHF18280.1 Signal transduction histidine kinase [Loktanella atrilutea]
MMRDEDTPARRIAKLERIVEALVERLERTEEARGPSYALTRAAALLEREIIARNDDLERALTDLEAINAQLAQAHAAADEANRAKSRFLRAASHDLLQPLSAAKMFLSHLANLSTDARQVDIVSHLTGTIESAEELIGALSQIARLDGRSVRLDLVPLSLDRLFWRLGLDLQPLAVQRGVDLRFVRSGLTVESDPVYLRQIAQNLIANALKYTDGAKVLVGVRRQGDTAWLEVYDQGPGIADADRARIFQEFERLGHSDQPGTGLGLSIVQRATHLLKHPLELHSEPGKGSRFRVGLPVRVGLCAMRAPDRNRHQSDFPQALRGLHVLVVENDPAMRQAFDALLTGWGMTVRTVDSIRAARQALAVRAPDLVLTDYRLDGGETGIQTIRQLRADGHARLPAVLVSGDDAEAMAADAHALNVALLAKPVDEAQLQRAMCAALADVPRGVDAAVTICG